ncbi:MAG: hypothetical protein ACRCZ0_04100 [Cetobacterium sp.]
MPKPRSPEFKDLRRPVEKNQKESKKTKKSNDMWTPSDDERRHSRLVDGEEVATPKRRSPAADVDRQSSRGSKRGALPIFAEVEKVSPSVAAHDDVQSDYEELDSNQKIQQTLDSYPRKYPEAIANLIELSLMEADQVRESFKGRRQNYVRIFQAYKDKLADRDYSIIRGATGYLYENSRIKSINEETALWMLGIYEIPASQIQSYTSKAVLEKIAKNCGLSISGKKAEVLIKNIRSVIDSSK